MVKTRRLQYIGNQFLLNVPKSVAEASQWEKGDHIAVAQKSKDTLEMRKIGTKDMTHAEIETSRIKEEIRLTYNMLLTTSERMNPTAFSWQLSELSHLFGKLRKYGIKNYEQTLNKNVRKMLR